MASRVLILLAIVFAVTDGARIAPLIVGGKDTYTTYPYLVSLRVHGFHNCGGSIINHHWVMTAAHCLKEKVLKEYTIVLGAQYSDTGGYAYRVAEIIAHPKYGTSGKDYDIGLLRTRDYIEYNDIIRPIALATREIDERNATAFFAGWGDNYKTPTTHILQSIELNVLELSKCQQYFEAVTPLQLCTLNKVGEGFCFGDSGSPLMVNGEQVGIASWGSPCGYGFPDVFTRVWSHMDWIKSYIEN